MRTLFCLILLVSSVVGVCQEAKPFHLNTKRQKTRVFIICRGTSAKANLIVRQFNLMDSNTTHIAIGYVHNKSLRIYGVEDSPGSKSALKYDSLSSYTGSRDVLYWSVWEFSVKPGVWRRVKKACTGYERRRIVFDYDFRLDNPDTLYCSEFCANVLKKARIKRLRIYPNLTQLNGLFFFFLNRKELEYYPVDFFQTTSLFAKVYQWKKSE